VKFPVFDLHCDTAFALLGRDFKGSVSLLNNDLHIDLQRAGELSAYAQCFACFTSDHESLPLPISPEKLFDEEQNPERQRTEISLDREEKAEYFACGQVSSICELIIPALCAELDGFDYQEAEKGAARRYRHSDGRDIRNIIKGDVWGT